MHPTRVITCGCARSLIILGAVTGLAATPVSAAVVYVLDSADADVAVAHLNSLGHTATVGDSLDSYIGYDQVWDLRVDSALGASDMEAMSSFLAAGGRMFLAGEGDDYMSRNQSIVSFTDSIGAGQVTLTGAIGGADFQSITAAGQVVNYPNFDHSILEFEQTGIAQPDPDRGFLVSVSFAEPSSGSPIGWDIGEIESAPDARLLVGFDADFFSANGPTWTENMATFLGDAVPEPTTMTLLAVASVAILRRTRRER